MVVVKGKGNKISKEKIKKFLLVFPFFSNYYMTNIPLLYYITLVIKVGIIIYMLIVYLRKYKKRLIRDEFLILSVLYISVLLVSTFVNHGNYVKYSGYVISSVGFAFLLCIKFRDSYLGFLEALYSVFRFNFVIDLSLLIIFPNGLTSDQTRYTFLGMDNPSMPWILCGFVVFFLYNILKNGKKITPRLIFDLTVVLSITIILNSGTGITGMMVCIICIVLFTLVPRVFSFKVSFALILVVFVLINVLNNATFFAPYIEGVLGKDLTFTDRTQIWATSIQMARENWKWGFGIQDNQRFVLATSNMKYKMAHNEYLQTVLNGGVIYLFIFLTLIMRAGSGLDKITKYNDKRELLPANIVKGGIVGLMTMFLAEAYGNQLILFVLLILADYYIRSSKTRNSLSENIKSKELNQYYRRIFKAEL